MIVEPFRNTDESEEALYRIKALINGQHIVTETADNCLLAAYRVADAASGNPLLPSPADLALAVDVLQRLTACHAHLYERRRREGEDWPLNSKH